MKIEMDDCYCLIRHAITKEGRDQAKKSLAEARRLGDNIGILVAIAALGPCPSIKKDENGSQASPI